MADTISYQYAAPSALQRSADQDELFLAKYSEIEKKDAPCFFWGKLTQPYMTARCLIALSNVVQSSFNLTPAQLSMLKDPIVTAGNNRLRFEGFSNCAGVYARCAPRWARRGISGEWNDECRLQCRDDFRFRGYQQARESGDVGRPERSGTI